MGDQSLFTISVKIEGLAGEPWKNFDELEDRLRRLLEAKSLPSDLSTDEALLALVAAESGTPEWYAFHAIDSIAACRECFELGHHEIALVYAVQAVAMGMRADPSTVDPITAQLAARSRELREKQRLTGQKTAGLRKKRTNDSYEVWIRNARALKAREPDWSRNRIAAELAPGAGVAQKTIYAVILTALKP